ncbi:MAG: PH domain-containing protein [Bacteroidota bacterium]
MKRFSSSKNIFLYGFMIVLCVFLLFILYILPLDTRENQPPDWVFYILIPTIVIGLIWILCDTKYIIKNKLMYYSSGPIRGKIDIEKIREVTYHSGWYVSTILKPALGTNGLLIRYNQFDDIYISPKEQEEFIAELIKINPNIIIE